MAAEPPPIPPPAPKLRADGTVKAPSLRSSLWVLGVGLVLFVAAGVALVPPLIDSVSGPRFAIPGERTLDLDQGTWTIYQHTSSTRGATSGGVASGGVTVTHSRPVTLRPEDVSITGPASVQVWVHRFGSETMTRGSKTYTGAVRFRLPESGRYTVAITGEPGEVLIARPVLDLLSRWPWMVAGAIGGLLVVAGFVMWLVGAGNRRVARRAGIPV